MPWLVVEFEIAEELGEVAAEALRTAGANGAAEEWRKDRHYVRGFWQDAEREHVVAATESALRALRDTGLLAEAPPFSIVTMEDDDWLEGWKQYFPPLVISPRLAIVPSWESFTPGPGQAVVTLDPGMAFGTGSHGTTFACLQSLADYLTPGMTVCDVGTGSGILAIAAVKLGAGRVTATDNDALAVRIARENAERNAVGERIIFLVTDLLEGVAGPFSLITANILAPVILQLIPSLPRVLMHGGIFISSGYITGQEEDIRLALEASGHRLLGRYQRDDWVTLVSERG